MQTFKQESVETKYAKQKKRMASKGNFSLYTVVTFANNDQQV